MPGAPGSHANVRCDHQRVLYMIIQVLEDYCIARAELHKLEGTIHANHRILAEYTYIVNMRAGYYPSLVAREKILRRDQLCITCRIRALVSKSAINQTKLGVMMIKVITECILIRYHTGNVTSIDRMRVMRTAVTRKILQVIKKVFNHRRERLN